MTQYRSWIASEKNDLSFKNTLEGHVRIVNQTSKQVFAVIALVTLYINGYNRLPLTNNHHNHPTCTFGREAGLLVVKAVPEQPHVELLGDVRHSGQLVGAAHAG